MADIPFKKKGRKISLKPIAGAESLDPDAEFEALMARTSGDLTLIFAEENVIGRNSLMANAEEDEMGSMTDQFFGNAAWQQAPSDFAPSFRSKPMRATRNSVQSDESFEKEETMVDTRAQKKEGLSAESKKRGASMPATAYAIALAQSDVTSGHSKGSYHQPDATSFKKAHVMEIVHEGPADEFIIEEDEDDEGDGYSDAGEWESEKHRQAHALRQVRRRALKQQAKTVTTMEDESEDGVRNIADVEEDGAYETDEEVVVLDKQTVSSGGYSKLTNKRGKAGHNNKRNRHPGTQTEYVVEDESEEDETMREAMIERLRTGLGGGEAAEMMIARIGNSSKRDILSDQEDILDESINDEESVIAYSSDEDNIESQRRKIDDFDFSTSSSQDGSYLSREEARWGEDAHGLVPLIYPYASKLLLKKRARGKRVNDGKDDEESVETLSTTLDMIVLRPQPVRQSMITASESNAGISYSNSNSQFPPSETPARRHMRASRLSRELRQRMLRTTFEDLDLADERERIARSHSKGLRFDEHEALNNNPHASSIIEQTFQKLNEAKEKAIENVEVAQSYRNTCQSALEAIERNLRELERNAERISEEYIVYERSTDFIADISGMLSSKLPYLSALQRGFVECKRRRYAEGKSMAMVIYSHLLSSVGLDSEEDNKSAMDIKMTVKTNVLNDVDEFGRSKQVIQTLATKKMFQDWLQSKPSIGLSSSSGETIKKFLKGQLWNIDAIKSKSTHNESSENASNSVYPSLESLACVLSVEGGCTVPIPLLKASEELQSAATTGGKPVTKSQAVDPLLGIQQVYKPGQELGSMGDPDDEDEGITTEIENANSTSAYSNSKREGKSMGWSSRALRPEAIAKYSLSSAVKGEQRHHFLTLALRHLFDDANSQFRSFEKLLDVLATWKEKNAKRYKEAYITQMLPLLLAPYVRIELLSSKLFEFNIDDQSRSSMETENWFKALKDFSESTKGLSEPDPDRQIVPAIITASIIPILETLIIYDWSGVLEGLASNNCYEGNGFGLYPARVYDDPWGELIEQRKMRSQISIHEDMKMQISETSANTSKAMEQSMRSGHADKSTLSQKSEEQRVQQNTAQNQKQNQDQSGNDDDLAAIEKLKFGDKSEELAHENEAANEDEDEDEDEDVRRARMREQNSTRFALEKRLERERLDLEEDLAREKEAKERQGKGHGGHKDRRRDTAEAQSKHTGWMNVLDQFSPTYASINRILNDDSANKENRNLKLKTEYSYSNHLQSLVDEVLKICVSQPNVPLDSEIDFYCNWRDRNQGIFQLGVPDEVGEVARDAMCSRLLSTVAIRLAFASSEISEWFSRVFVQAMKRMKTKSGIMQAGRGQIEKEEYPIYLLIHLVKRALLVLSNVVQWRKTLSLRDDPEPTASVEPPFQTVRMSVNDNHSSESTSKTRQSSSSSSTIKIPSDYRVDALLDSTTCSSLPSGDIKHSSHAHAQESNDKTSISLQLKKRLVEIFSRSNGRYPNTSSSGDKYEKLPLQWMLPNHAYEQLKSKSKEKVKQNSRNRDSADKTAQAIAYYVLIETILPFIRLCIRMLLQLKDHTQDDNTLTNDQHPKERLYDWQNLLYECVSGVLDILPDDWMMKSELQQADHENAGHQHVFTHLQTHLHTFKQLAMQQQKVTKDENIVVFCNQRAWEYLVHSLLHSVPDSIVLKSEK